MPIGKLESVPLRELWKHEELDFSAWLENNIETLSEALGLTLTLVQREKTAGAFQVDLVAEDADGRLVILENQLEPTDHDHLGKVLTYLTNLEARAAIWVTSDARPEHIRAVAWLNEATPADIAFYLVRKEKGMTSHANISPSKENWISAGAGRSGLSYNYVIWRNERTGVELYIDTGERDQNKRIFDRIAEKKAEVESIFGDSLQWERLDDARASRIRFVIRKGGLRDDESNWASMQDAMIDAMDRLTRALKPLVHALHS